MKIGAVIAEYNFFHNGHQFQLEVARKGGIDAVVAIMSGNFVQRSEPAIVSKFVRADMAVRCGVDLVIELPVAYATASSGRFALGAVSIADGLGCVDELFFGSESGSVEQLCEMADIVTQTEVEELIRILYQQGNSYPKARLLAVEMLYGKSKAAVLNGRNNILAIDYIKALRKLKSSVRPATVRRTGSGHDSAIPMGNIASASWLRERAREKEEVLAAYVPQEVLLLLKEERKRQAFSDGYRRVDRLILHKLREMGRDRMRLIPDCADGLGSRLYRAALDAQCIDEVYERAKTRRYTMSRVRRAVLWAVMDIDKRYFVPPPYARILAIGSRGQEILASMKQTAGIPFSHDLKILRSQGDTAALFAKTETRATDFFSLTTERTGAKGQDFTQKLIKVR